MKNLAYVVNRVQLDLQDFTTHNVPAILQHIIHAYKNELKFTASKSVKVAYLTLSDVHSAAFPKDYEYYTKIAISCGNKYITLSRNQGIPLQRLVNDCGQPRLEDAVCCGDNVDMALYTDGFFYVPHWRDGQYVGEFYSMGGGYNEAGYFREDFEMRQFQFANVPRGTVVLEYVADEDTSINTMIPFSAVEPLRQYAHWQMVEYKRSTPLYEKQRAQDRYMYAREMYRAIVWAFTAQDYLDVCYETSRSGPKR